MERHPSHQRLSPGSNEGLPHFHRKSICEARLEFAGMDSAEHIIEAGLLTAIGTLGLTRGVSIYRGTESSGCFSRGVDPETLACLDDRFDTFFDSFFSGLELMPYPFHAQIVFPDPGRNSEELLISGGIVIVVGWQMGSCMRGMTGFGTKIISDRYGADDAGFILNLWDTMLTALEAVGARIRLQGLRQELERESGRCEELSKDLVLVQQELEHTRFRLSGFNDIFQELSSLKKAVEVIDAFLLMLLGIFSAGGGYIIYLDSAMDTAHMILRGREQREPDVRELKRTSQELARILASAPVLELAPMQARILSRQQSAQFGTLLPETECRILFRVDETAAGVIGLDERLTHESYGSHEEELLLTFVRTVMVFLENCKSFETIERLRVEQEKRNRELETTLSDLRSSRKTIARLESAGERIRNAVTSAMARSEHVSFRDVTLILLAGILLGLVYNYASPGGIAIIPELWSRPAMAQVDAVQARKFVTTRGALVVDARPAEFFDQEHISDAVNLPPPLFDFIYMMRFSRLDRDLPVIVYGRTVSRHYDEETAFRLTERGHTEVMVFPGGIQRWKRLEKELEP